MSDSVTLFRVNLRRLAQVLATQGMGPSRRALAAGAALSVLGGCLLVAGSNHGLTGGECIPQATRCEGDGVRVCDADGLWKGAFSLCGSGCADGTCTKSTRRCAFREGSRFAVESAAPSQTGDLRVLAAQSSSGVVTVLYSADSSRQTYMAATIRLRTQSVSAKGVPGRYVGASRTISGYDVFLLSSEGISVRKLDDGVAGASLLSHLDTWASAAPSKSGYPGHAVVPFGADYLFASGDDDGVTRRLGVGRGSRLEPSDYVTITSTPKTETGDGRAVDSDCVAGLGNTMYVLTPGVLSVDHPPTLWSLPVPVAAAVPALASQVESRSLRDEQNYVRAYSVWSTTDTLNLVAAFGRRATAPNYAPITLRLAEATTSTVSAISASSFRTIASFFSGDYFPDPMNVRPLQVAGLNQAFVTGIARNAPGAVFFWFDVSTGEVLADFHSSTDSSTGMLLIDRAPTAVAADSEGVAVGGARTFYFAWWEKVSDSTQGRIMFDILDCRPL